MSWLVFSWVYPVWNSLCFLNLTDYFLFYVGEIFNYNLFKNVLTPFLFLFFFWEPLIQMLVCLILSQRSLRLSSVLFILFTLFCSSEVISSPGSIPGLGRSPAEGNGNPFWLLPGKYHGLRSLVGYSPWGSQRVGHNWATSFSLSLLLMRIRMCAGPALL